MHAPSRSYWQQQKKKNKQVNREFAARPHCHIATKPIMTNAAKMRLQTKSAKELKYEKNKNN